MCRYQSALQYRADWDAVAAELGTHRTADAVSAKYGQITDKRPGCAWEVHVDDTKNPAVRPANMSQAHRSGLAPMLTRLYVHVEALLVERVHWQVPMDRPTP
jgi:hypothetical protein